MVLPYVSSERFEILVEVYFSLEDPVQRNRVNVFVVVDRVREMLIEGI